MHKFPTNRSDADRNFAYFIIDPPDGNGPRHIWAGQADSGSHTKQGPRWGEGGPIQNEPSRTTTELRKFRKNKKHVREKLYENLVSSMILIIVFLITGLIRFNKL